MPLPHQALIADIPVSRISLNPFEAAAPIKVELALGLLDGSVTVLE
jgi:hypothetical protein